VTVWTIIKVLQWTVEHFQKHGIASARLDAEILMSRSLGIPRIKLYTDFEKILTPGELAAIRELVQRRLKHEPVAYILGEKEWYSEKFKVGPGVLIPRPETELIVDEVKKTGLAGPARVLDLGTGSGCLAVVIKKLFPHAEVTASDISEKALETAKENALRILGADLITFVASDLFGEISGPFDLIVSNPPYIPDGAVIDRTVREYEPPEALFAGPDGMDFYRRFLPEAPGFLAPGGRALLELGLETAVPVTGLIDSGRFGHYLVNDLNKIPRLLVLTLK
jgi:release factor glutamine methyltransferase